MTKTFTLDEAKIYLWIRIGFCYDNIDHLENFLRSYFEIPPDHIERPMFKARPITQKSLDTIETKTLEYRREYHSK